MEMVRELRRMGPAGNRIVTLCRRDMDCHERFVELGIALEDLGVVLNPPGVLCARCEIDEDELRVYFEDGSGLVGVLGCRVIGGKLICYPLGK